MCPFTRMVDGHVAYVFSVAAQRAGYVSHDLVRSVDLNLLVAHAFL